MTIPRSLSAILSLLLMAGGASAAPANVTKAATGHIWTCVDQAGHRTMQDHACGEGAGSREAEAARGRVASRPPVVAEGQPRPAAAPTPAAPRP